MISGQLAKNGHSKNSDSLVNKSGHNESIYFDVMDEEFNVGLTCDVELDTIDYDYFKNSGMDKSMENRILVESRPLVSLTQSGLGPPAIVKTSALTPPHSMNYVPLSPAPHTHVSYSITTFLLKLPTPQCKQTLFCTYLPCFYIHVLPQSLKSLPRMF